MKTESRELVLCFSEFVYNIAVAVLCLFTACYTSYIVSLQRNGGNPSQSKNSLNSQRVCLSGRSHRSTSSSSPSRDRCVLSVSVSWCPPFPFVYVTHRRRRRRRVHVVRSRAFFVAYMCCAACACVAWSLWGCAGEFWFRPSPRRRCVFRMYGYII